MKTLKDFMKGYKQKSADLQKEIDKLPVDDKEDPAGNKGDVFNGDKVKVVDRKGTRHGYASGEDEAVYEEKEIPLSHRGKRDVSHYRVLNNGRDVTRHDSYEEANEYAKKHRAKLKKDGYRSDQVTVHAYVKEEAEQIDESHQVSYNNYTITSGRRVPGGEAGDIKHSLAHTRKMASLGIEHDNAGDYGETRRLTVRNNDTGETTHHHVYQREWDSGKNKPVVSIRSVGKPQAASEKHHNVIAHYLSGKTKLKEEIDLEEKTLTRAELSKREEVVKALKKRGMEKSKAFAIATATAKRVAEDVEELDEAGLVVPRRDNLVSLKKHSFSDDGLEDELKATRQTKKSVEDAKKKYAKEEVEDLEEKLSDEAKEVIRKTVKTTGAKAKPLVKLAQMGKKTPIRPVDEEALDELSKGTLGSYVKKSGQSIEKHGIIGGLKVKSGEDATSNFKKSDNRIKGINRAVDRLTKEDIINRTIEKYMPEDYELPTPTDRFLSKVSDLSERHINTLLAVFESLNEDNQMRMIDMADTREGINGLLNFALDARAE